MQFEKDTTNADDPFNIGEMIRDVTENAGGGRKHDREASEDRNAKRARVDDDT